MAFNPERCFKFTCLSGSVTIKTNTSSVDGSHYKFSKDDGQTWVNDSISLSVGEYAYLKGTNFPRKSGDGSTSRFTCTGSGTFGISGSLMSFADDGAGELDTVPSNGSFRCLFRGITQLTKISGRMFTAANIPASCYEYFAAYCPNLNNISGELFAESGVAQNCFYSCFSNCPSLTISEDVSLPATTASYFCGKMFENSGIPSIPENFLPATELAPACYELMFKGCTGLTEVISGTMPVLESAESKCCQEMFADCSNISSIAILWPEWPEGDATLDWVKNVADEGSFYAPAALDLIYDDDHVPTNWEVNPRPTVLYFKKRRIEKEIYKKW